MFDMNGYNYFLEISGPIGLNSLHHYISVLLVKGNKKLPLRGLKPTSAWSRDKAPSTVPSWISCNNLSANTICSMFNMMGLKKRKKRGPINFEALGWGLLALPQGRP
jgi:hypothetical protein